MRDLKAFEIVTLLLLFLITNIYLFLPVRNIPFFNLALFKDSALQYYQSRAKVCDSHDAGHNLPICQGCDDVLEFGAESLNGTWKPFSCDMAEYSFEKFVNFYRFYHVLQ